MREQNEIRISVRNLVEFVLRSGNLDSRFMGAGRALEGTRAHQKLQRQRKEVGAEDYEYADEVWMTHTIEYEGFTLTVEGRADGVITEGNHVAIDEIKTTTQSLEYIDEDYNPLHWAQAKCYAYIYAIQNNLRQIDIQLSYYQLDTEEVKNIRKTFLIDSLEAFFDDLVSRYFIWANFVRDWTAKRNASIKKMEFPFETYRKGQRELAVAVYRTIAQQKKIFVQAPTGIGKTISTVFPSVKAIGEGVASKIFYLTAKTITRQVAEEAFVKMSTKGLQFKSLTLTAKDKICFKEESNCNPEYCEYAKGHFDRVNDAIMEVLTNETGMTREVVEQYAKRYSVCPFEFSLDLAIWSDCVICDYNYVFDPRVYLRRFFDESGGDYVLLIDEAHNLVDRAREMFSAELCKSTFLDGKRIMKEKEPKIAKVLGKLNRFMIDAKKECKDHPYVVKQQEPKEIYPLLRQFTKEAEEWLTKNEQDDGYSQLLDLYFNALEFTRIAEFYDERYVTYIEKTNGDVKLKLFCLDPSYLLSEAVKRGKAAVFFSATLTPVSYFRDMLGGGQEDYTMCLPSPFDRKNLCLLIGHTISTKYKKRETSYDDIVEYINTVVSQKEGNYLVFFPSYQYMHEVFERFSEKYPGINTLLQASGMVEEEREAFLNRFQPDAGQTLVGFAVLGGIFSEGIDLQGERLSGAIIVGVGLPQICPERNIIKHYFDEKNGRGFEYAYMYPGMNKVLQAAGRVIRSESDRGVVLLIDERFAYGSYRKLFPKEWNAYQKVNTINDIAWHLVRFKKREGVKEL